MNSVTLGQSNIRISRLGLGCMGMSEFYGATDDAESLAIIDRALELGINFSRNGTSLGGEERGDAPGNRTPVYRESLVALAIIRTGLAPRHLLFSYEPLSGNSILAKQDHAKRPLSSFFQ